MEQFIQTLQNFMDLVRCFTYNHSAYITDALNGFTMQQTNFPFVIVLVDDASTDGEQEVIQEYIKTYFKKSAYQKETDYANITYAQHISNKNCYIAAYLLKENHYSQKKKKAPYVKLWRDKCKYEAICEGDDFWTDSLKLQKQVDFLENNPEYVLSYCNRFVINASGKHIRTNVTPGRSGDLFQYLLFKGNPITTASVIYRLDAYTKAFRIIKEQNLKNLSMGDFQLWIVLSKLGKFYYVNDKMVTYRILNESASHSSNDYQKIVKFGEDELLIKKHFYKLFTKQSADKIFEKEFYKILIRKMAQYEKGIFIKYYIEGIRKYPSLVGSPKLLYFLLYKYCKK